MKKILTILFSGICMMAFGALTIVNLPTTNITTTSAWFNASITATNGTGTNPTCIVFYGAIDYTTNANSWGYSNVYGQAGIATISTQITALSALHKYYYRWRAIEGTSTAWSASTSNFWTKPTAPTSTPAVVTISLQTDTNGLLKAPTNFFNANSNLMNIAIGAGTYAKQADYLATSNDVDTVEALVVLHTSQIGSISNKIDLHTGQIGDNSNSIFILQGATNNLNTRVTGTEANTTKWEKAATDAASATNSIFILQGATNNLNTRVTGIEANTTKWEKAAVDAASATNSIIILQGATNTLNAARLLQQSQVYAISNQLGSATNASLINYSGTQFTGNIIFTGDGVSFDGTNLVFTQTDVSALIATTAALEIDMDEVQAQTNVWHTGATDASAATNDITGLKLSTNYLNSITVKTNTIVYVNLLTNTATKAQGTLADTALQSVPLTNDLINATNALNSRVNVDLATATNNLYSATNSLNVRANTLESATNALNISREYTNQITARDGVKYPITNSPGVANILEFNPANSTATFVAKSSAGTFNHPGLTNFNGDVDVQHLTAVEKAIATNPPSLTDLNNATNSLNVRVNTELVYATNALNNATNNLNAIQINVVAATNALNIVANAAVKRNGDIMTGALTNNILFAGNGAGLTNVPGTETNLLAFHGESGVVVRVATTNVYWGVPAVDDLKAATNALNTRATNLEGATGSLNTAVGNLNNATNTLNIVANAALPTAGGTMTGALTNNVAIWLPTNGFVYFGSTNCYIQGQNSTNLLFRIGTNFINFDIPAP